MRNLMFIWTCLICAIPCQARTITVDDDGPADFDNIQAAIDDANDGDTVIVAAGTYSGAGNRNIDFLGKAITVRSQNGPENCIIDCNGTESDPHRAFHFHNGEGGNSVLSGFTITRAYMPKYTVSDYGAIYCSDNSSPTISNCRIEKSKCGISCNQSNPLITHCLITYNYESGIICKDTTSMKVTNCIISYNEGFRGGGIFCNPGTLTISDCIISRNKAENGGGAVWLNSDEKPTINNCIIFANQARYGGAILCNGSDPVITNSNIIANKARYCAGIYCTFYSSPTLTNSIMWANTAFFADQIYLSSYEDRFTTITISYSNIQGGLESVYVSEGSTLNWGLGNINADPCFAFVGDYHLMPGSACVDAGTHNPTGGLPTFDLDGNPRSLDGDENGSTTPDIGACEFNPAHPTIGLSSNKLEFFKPQDGPNPDDQILYIRNAGGDVLEWEIQNQCNWLDVIPSSGTSIGEANNISLIVDAAGLDHGTYDCSLSIVDDRATNTPRTVDVTLNVNLSLKVPDDYDTIQAAIDAAVADGDVVVVGDGVYSGDGNTNLDFRGRPITLKSQNGPENCIIHPTDKTNEPLRAFYFHSMESPNSVVDGFTVTGGHAHGTTYWWESCGGAIYSTSSPTIKNCVFRANSAKHGGAIYCRRNSYSKILNCIFTANSATSSGGALYSEGYANPTVRNCIFTANSGGWGGGAIRVFQRGWASVRNCTFASNFAPNGNAINVTGNYPGLELTNSILADGGSEIFLDEEVTVVITYSNVQGGWEGQGNIDADPCFAEAGYWDANALWVEGDYRLQEGSTCIDSGDPNYVAEPNETDLDGRPRVLDGDEDGTAVVDMGAYEFEFLPAIEAVVKISPKTLNLRSKGRWITCYIWLPEDYNVAEIEPNSVLLEDEIPAERVWLTDEFAVAKFSRAVVQEVLGEVQTPAEVELVVSGELSDGTIFEGADTIRVIDVGGGKNSDPPGKAIKQLNRNRKRIKGL